MPLGRWANGGFDLRDQAAVLSMVGYIRFGMHFRSRCANSNVPEQMVMDWLGHNNSPMIRYYYHHHNEQARSWMNDLDLLGGAGGRSADGKQAT